MPTIADNVFTRLRDSIRPSGSKECLGRGQVMSGASEIGNYFAGRSCNPGSSLSNTA